MCHGGLVLVLPSSDDAIIVVRIVIDGVSMKQWEIFQSKHFNLFTKLNDSVACSVPSLAKT